MRSHPGLFLVLAVTLLAGCAAAPGPQPAPSDAPVYPSAAFGPQPHGSDARAPPGPRTLALAACNEITYTVTMPTALEDVLPGGVHPAPVAGSRYVYRTDQTATTCRSASDGNRTAGPVSAQFVLVRVEPIEGLALPGAAAYYFGTSMVSAHPLVRDALETVGLDAWNGTVDVSFQPVGPRADARGHLRLRGGPADRDVDTVMADSLVSGAAGTLGLYTFDGRRILLHAVEFSDYRAYTSGAAIVSNPAGNGALVGPEPETYPAVHNLQYDLRFEFNRAFRPYPLDGKG